MGVSTPDLFHWTWRCTMKIDTINPKCYSTSFKGEGLHIIVIETGAEAWMMPLQNTLLEELDNPSLRWPQYFKVIGWLQRCVLTWHILIGWLDGICVWLTSDVTKQGSVLIGWSKMVAHCIMIGLLWGWPKFSWLAEFQLHRKWGVAVFGISAYCVYYRVSHLSRMKRLCICFFGMIANQTLSFFPGPFSHLSLLAFLSHSKVLNASFFKERFENVQKNITLNIDYSF